MEKVVLQLDWELNAQFAGPIVALEEGIYASAGMDVELRAWKNGINIIKAVTEGHPTTLGCSEQSQIVAAQAAGEDIVAVATMLQRTPMGLMTADRGLETVGDLRNAKVGVHHDGWRMLEMFKSAHGLSNLSIETVDIADKFERVLSGELGAVQCYVVDEPIAIKRRYGLDTEPRVIDLGLTLAAETIFVRRSLLCAKRDLVARFLGATFDGWRLALTNRARAVRAIRALAPGLDFVHQTKMLERLESFVKGDITSPANLGRIDPASWYTHARSLYECGIVDSLLEPPDLDGSWHYPDEDISASIVFDRPGRPDRPWWTV